MDKQRELEIRIEEIVKRYTSQHPNSYEYWINFIVSNFKNKILKGQMTPEKLEIALILLGGYTTEMVEELGDKFSSTYGFWNYIEDRVNGKTLLIDTIENWKKPYINIVQLYDWTKPYQGGEILGHQVPQEELFKLRAESLTEYLLNVVIDTGETLGDNHVFLILLQQVDELGIRDERRYDYTYRFMSSDRYIKSMVTLLSIREWQVILSYPSIEQDTLWATKPLDYIIKRATKYRRDIAQLRKLRLLGQDIDIVKQLALNSIIEVLKDKQQGITREVPDT